MDGVAKLLSNSFYCKLFDNITRRQYSQKRQKRHMRYNVGVSCFNRIFILYEHLDGNEMSGVGDASIGQFDSSPVDCVTISNM